MTPRAVGIAPVKPVRLSTDELIDRSTAWRYIDAARAAARGDVKYHLDQARQDVEVLGSVLADILTLHEPRGPSPLCPGCSTPGHPHLWPCLTWKRIVGRFGEGW